MTSLRQRFEQIRQMAWTDFKLKYQGTVLGLLWTLLKPFMMLGILYVVFRYFLSVQLDNFYLYILLGLTYYNFLTDATKDAMQSLEGKADILQQMHVPPALVVISTCLHSFLTFLINIAIFTVLYLVSGLNITWNFLPFLLLTIPFFFFVYGTALITALLFLRFDDFSHIWDVFLKMLFWATPIVYPVENVPQWFERFYMANPLTRYIVDARNFILYDFTPHIKQLTITLAITILTVTIGYYLFTTYQRRYIERL